MSQCIFVVFHGPPLLMAMILLFSLPLGSTLTYHLPTENRQEHLEGKVLSPRTVNMGIAARAVTTNVIHHIDLIPLSWCPWPSKFV